MGEAARSPWARVDDLVAGRGHRFGGCRATLVARRPGEVVPVLAEAERAAASGRWVVGFVAYEAAPGLDPSLPGRATPHPLAWFGVFAQRRPVPVPAPPAAGPLRGALGAWALDTDDGAHGAGVHAVRARIAAGDVYQCNLTARYAGAVPDPPALYRRLAVAQRSAHCAYVDTGDLVVASASPELFFEWAGDALVTRPMKGTARRGRWPDEDRRQAAALAASEKDRAENVMIVDLLRNDLGKVARFGSVRVPALFTLERYPTVWQLTSTVAAEPRPGTTLADVFGALFPSGSVTGAPKRRAMQVIGDLEDTPRGPYCGAVGVVAPPGAGFRARFNVAIRTAVVDRRTGGAVYGSGGGIVWDSDPAAEYAELRAKAAVLREPPVAGFSLLETMRGAPGGGVRRGAAHRRRLLASADYFGVPADAARLDAAVAAATAQLPGASRVRLLLGPAGDPVVEVDALGDPPSGPVRLAVDPEPVDTDGPWPFHKTTRRAPYERRAARHPGADQVVLVNDRHEVTETTVANLAVRLGGRWWTPPVASGCLPGVLRAELVGADRLGERPLTVADLRGAEALAVLSALRGWRPAVLAAEAGRALAV